VGFASHLTIRGAVLKLIEERKIQHAGASVPGSESMAVDVKPTTDKTASDVVPDRELLLCVARTTLRTKLSRALADSLADICVDAVLCVRQPGRPIDLFMVEVQEMMHRTGDETRLVRGLVLDHGSRHPDMPKRLEKCFILTLNCGTLSGVCVCVRDVCTR
jgi:T-complex protein 1 subunit zeta